MPLRSSRVLKKARSGGRATVIKLNLIEPRVVELAGLQWTREDFCRGWPITGDTGSVKTRSGINSRRAV